MGEGMRRDSDPPAAGWQIVVLMIAVMFAGVIAEKYVLPRVSWTGDTARIAMFGLAFAILFGLAPVRRKSLQLLSAPLAPARLVEVVGATILVFATVLGIYGAIALWWWSTGGEPALARHTSSIAAPRDALEQSFAADYLFRTFALGALAAPLIEEVVFRGFLYTAWERRWGWATAALLTSFAFAALHSWGVPQFFASLVFIALYRRTGSLWAPMLCHSAFNIAMWFPLGGQFVSPQSGRISGELSAWTVNLICLAIAFFAIPIYLWMSRDEAISAKDDGAPIPLPARD
jgi:membrane protease YdiL (CAAX protease family)